MVFYGYTPHFSLLLENSCRASRTLHLANANLLFAAAPLFSLRAAPARRVVRWGLKNGNGMAVCVEAKVVGGVVEALVVEDNVLIMTYGS